mgnify:CR=1 FL=1
MKTHEEMKNTIMRRVWAIYLFRKVASPAVRAGILAASIIILIGQVSVPNVVQNAYNVSDVMGLMTFMLSAFLDTSALVQLALLAFGVVVLLSVIDITKRFSSEARAFA